ncbi:cellulose binding domain-containing protein [Glycomyces tritici]|uniref:Cellulose binding domain-containing protein n=1 Tax=Glycomyces tritici TaxID=2665176 RepID=A0ABT7YLN1_9ACTN|nr:cellulose binding domain-containing protein [Glycomyces tritici]MDN3239527.1 cellulose binding domain-containing protein [Glycomyces tritici]
MDEAGGALGDSPGGRGRLHGRLLQVLGGVSAVAAAVALWQFVVSGDDPDRDPVSVVEGLETLSVPEGASPSGAVASVHASSAAVESPSESSAAASSEAPTSASPSPSPSEEVTSAAGEESAAAACTASLSVEKEWDDSVEVQIEVVSSGGVALEAWEIDLDLRDVDIYHHWNMRELGDGRYGSEDWNGRLDPEENAVAGFQAATDDGADLPGSVPCTAVS